MKDKKWKLALWTWILCAFLIIAAMISWLLSVFGLVESAEGAGGIITQGLGGIAGILALYGAANVWQKEVIGKNYKAELDDRKLDPPG